MKCLLFDGGENAFRSLQGNWQIFKKKKNTGSLAAWFLMSSEEAEKPQNRKWLPYNSDQCKQGTKSPFRMVKIRLSLNSAVNWLKPHRYNTFHFRFNAFFKENNDLVHFAVCSVLLKMILTQGNFSWNGIWWVPLQVPLHSYAEQLPLVSGRNSTISPVKLSVFSSHWRLRINTGCHSAHCMTESALVFLTVAHQWHLKYHICLIIKSPEK
jgi:hypothetical protein